jgi:fructosamine-3-kinase
MSDRPGSLIEPIRAALSALGDSTPLRQVQLLGGGCINHAMRLVTGRSAYLLKYNSDPLPGMFRCEAEGLKRLADTHTVRVPAVLGYQEASAPAAGAPYRPAWILLEYLEGARSGDPARLGEQLAELHRQGQSPRNPPAYGLYNDNYLGSTLQVNGWESSWTRFFAEYRLRPQMETGRRNGRVGGERQKWLQKLIQRLPGLLGEIARRPSLVHGDLWSGNVIPGPDGFALIDPAVSYSDREVEMAYTELFGGFSSRFYAAYNSAWPLDPGYPERRDLYNLYHLLNHLNLFGESYGSAVDGILRRFC